MVNKDLQIHRIVEVSMSYLIQCSIRW